MMLKVNCHPHQLIADDDSFRSRPNIPHLTHKVHLLIVSTTQVKAQIKTSYIPNNHTKHMNDIKHVLPGYLCSNSAGINECLLRFCSFFVCTRTSQVTYVTMVSRVGNETLRPLGVAMGERHQRDSCLKHT